MFATQSSAQDSAFLHQFGGGGHRFVHHLRLAGVKQHTGMQVAVAGVEHIGDSDAVARADFAYLAEHTRQLGARHYPVHQVVIRGDGAECAESRFATEPQPFPFCVLLCDADIGGSGIPQRRGHRGAQLLNLLIQTLQLNQQHGSGVIGIAGVGNILHGADAQSVNHFQGGGNDALADDGGNGGAGGINIGKDAEKSPHRFRRRQQPYQYAGGNAESALRADKRPAQVIAGRLARRSAQVDDFAVLQDCFHADDMVGGCAVGQAVGAAGVFGDIAAQAARALAGRVGGIAQPELARVVVQIQVDDARFDQRSAVDGVHFNDAVHPGESDLQSVRGGNCAAAQAGAAAASDYRNAGGIRQRHNPAYLVGVGRQHHGARH